MLYAEKIAEIKKSITPTEQMQILDADGMRVFPGFIDSHSHIGIAEEKTTAQGDDSNENTNPITPCLRAIDTINPMDSAFHNALASGITGVMVGPGSANAINAAKICGVEDRLGSLKVGKDADIVIYDGNIVWQ